jgi:hypothetical protein
VSVGAVAGFISLLGLPHPVMWLCPKKLLTTGIEKVTFCMRLPFSAWIGFIFKLLVPLFT